jgi:hypothetical protein
MVAYGGPDHGVFSYWMGLRLSAFVMRRAG